MNTKMKIGNVSYTGKVFLVPLEGSNIKAFRVLCRKYGAAIMPSQLFEASELIKNSASIIDISEKERPITIQLYGNNPKIMAEAAKMAEPHADIIDLNFDISDAQVMSKKKGSYLLKEPEKIGEIVKAVKEAVLIPVTVKIRSGYDTVNAVDVAMICENNGADAITVHARTTKDDIDDPASWSVIKHVKSAVKIPVIGSGGVTDALMAKKIVQMTNCDGIAVGRAARGNPYIFMQINQMLIGAGNLPEPKLKRKKDIFNEFYELYAKESDRKFDDFKKHTLYFFEGLMNSKQIIKDLSTKNSEEEINKYLREI